MCHAVKMKIPPTSCLGCSFHVAQDMMCIKKQEKKLHFFSPISAFDRLFLAQKYILRQPAWKSVFDCFTVNCGSGTGMTHNAPFDISVTFILAQCLGAVD